MHVMSVLRLIYPLYSYGDYFLSVAFVHNTNINDSNDIASIPEVKTLIGIKSLINAEKCFNGEITVPLSQEELGKEYELVLYLNDKSSVIGKFGRHTHLYDIDLSKNNKNIGKEAFYNCSGLNSVVIYDSVTNVGDYAFYNCQNLNSIEFPSSLTDLGSKIFIYCKNLTSITFNGPQPKLNAEVLTLGQVIPNALFISNVLGGSTPFPSTGTLYYPSGSNYTAVKNQLPSTWSYVEF